jgi:hypothetical protein
LNLQDDDFTAYKIDRFRRTGFLPGGAMPRMQILTAAEQKAFDTPPVFSDADRLTFFHVSDSLGAVLATLRNPTNRVCLVLSVGYFRVAKRFFVAPFNQADVAYVTHQLGYAVEQIDLGAYDAKASASRHRRLTLDYLQQFPLSLHAQ